MDFTQISHLAMVRYRDSLHLPFCQSYHVITICQVPKCTSLGIKMYKVHAISYFTTPYNNIDPLM
jgi:hypothetical protein